MSSDNNNNDNSDSYVSPEERKEHETIVLWEFRNAFQAVHERLLMEEDYGMFNDHHHHALTDEEHDQIEDLYTNPTLYCLGAGLATLGVVRLGRYAKRYRAERYFQPPQQQQSSGNYRLDIPSQNALPFPNAANTPKPSFLSRFGTVFVDVTLCAFSGAVVGTYMADMCEAEGNLADMPLAPGTSGIAREFCPVLIEEFEAQWKLIQEQQQNEFHDGFPQDSDSNNNNAPTNDTATLLDLGLVRVQIQADPIPASIHQDILQNPQNPNLQAYLQFVHNCQRRQQVERRLRRQRGLRQHVQVAIPEPGVVEELEEEEEDDGGVHEEEFTHDQLASWVADQNDK